jgi:branched-chain amino acid transport system substrate-binding protein
MPTRRDLLTSIAAISASQVWGRAAAGIAMTAAVLAVLAGAARAQEVVKIGLVQSMAGPFNTVGKAVVNGARLYVQEHGDTVAGKKIDLIVKDDTSVPDVAKRLARDLIVSDKVAFLGGGLTPSALTIAPLATEAKTPMLVMVSGASITTERSPYIVRTSFTLGQSSSIMADWVVKNGAKKIVTIVNDWAPGLESERRSRTSPLRVAHKSSSQCVCHC